MKTKYFKSNQAYFKFLHKNKNNIDVTYVKTIMKKNSQSHIRLCYEKKEAL